MICHARSLRDAGRRLAPRLTWLAGECPIVIALLRGGVPVAFEVARGLGRRQRLVSAARLESLLGTVLAVQ